MAKVVLSNISKSFGKKQILKNINLEIEDGEFVVLVGASGCGKSTLLRIIAGLEKQTEGSVFIGDNLVNNVQPKDRDIAMVFQSYALYPHLSVEDNIGLGLKVRKVANCEIKRRTERVAEILKLEDYLDAKPKELSGGQRQRVALARAIVREPKVFLMDEPLSNLDAKLRSQMRSEIKKLHKKLNATFIYVTHDQTEALTMGDRVVVLNEGRIQQIDTPQNIYNNPENVFVATFMGSNPMNIIEANIADGFMTSGDIKVALSMIPYALNDEKVLMGFRPEDVICEQNPQYSFNLIKFQAKVTFEENLGSHKNIYFQLKDKECCCIADAKTPTSDIVNLSINPASLQFFNVETHKPYEKIKTY